MINFNPVVFPLWIFQSIYSKRHTEKIWGFQYSPQKGWNIVGQSEILPFTAQELYWYKLARIACLWPIWLGILILGAWAIFDTKDLLATVYLLVH
jgi:hypothetical protein